MTSGKSPLKVAVIGGGLAGLECALPLLKMGCAVDIIETGYQSRLRHVDWDKTKHPGDEKVRYWTANEWAAGAGGLSHRLGGRSLCYHGVLLAPSSRMQKFWGRTWEARFNGQENLYASVIEDLSRFYPELAARALPSSAEALGVQHVPQAARLDSTNRFESYSPLDHIKEFVGSDRLNVIREHVSAIRRDKGNTWKIAITANRAMSKLQTVYDRCIFAASAIGNVQLLASSLERTIHTTITDHLCVGAFAKIRGGQELGHFRHQKLWTGFIPLPNLDTNIFLLERPRAPDGDRVVELMAIVEQSGEPDYYSTLVVNYGFSGALNTHIHGKTSDADLLRLTAVRAKIKQLIELLVSGSAKQLNCSDHLDETVRDDENETDRRWSSYAVALKAVSNSKQSNIYCEYELPYGGFEHESCCHPVGNRSGISISENFEVLELPGAYVAGPGVFPRLSEANPALTIIATSRWLGQYIGHS